MRKFWSAVMSIIALTLLGYVLCMNKVETAKAQIVTKTIHTQACSLLVAPNPFYTQMQISYYIPNNGSVSLFICDRRGQRVVTLVDNVTMVSGSYRINYVSKLSRGVYFIGLNADHVSQATKIVCLRQ